MVQNGVPYELEDNCIMLYLMNKVVSRQAVIQVVSILALVPLLFSTSFAQQDTIVVRRFQNYPDDVNTINPKQKQIIVKGNLSFSTYNLVMTAIEREISDLEAMECMALQKRDTATLRKLWIRDFTLDHPNELVAGNNPIPYYVSYSRLVNNFSAFQNVVYTSGTDSFQQLNTNGKLENVINRNYSHTWTLIAGAWKLTSKIRE